MHKWLVFLHILGAFGFLMAHGVSAAVALALRRERGMEQIKTLLNLSGSSYGVMYISLLVLMVSGIIAGFTGHWWKFGWIWVGLGLLILITFSMYFMGSVYYGRVRKAVGLPYLGHGKEQPAVEPLGEEEVAAMLNTSRPMSLLGIGVGGIVIILWLMVFKPF